MLITISNNENTISSLELSNNNNTPNVKGKVLIITIILIILTNYIINMLMFL